MPERSEGHASFGVRLRRLLAGRRVWWLVAVLLLVNWTVAAILTEPKHGGVEVPYSEFRQQLRADNVAEVTSVGCSAGPCLTRMDGRPRRTSRPYVLDSRGRTCSGSSSARA